MVFCRLGRRPWPISTPFPTLAELDEYLAAYTAGLTTYSSAALAALKRSLWQGTDHWDTLLAERAAVSGALVRQPAAQAALADLG
ncbi:MAG: hypothetical protein HC821_02605 [Lewinella sp.]|nr:hypothetical protein [Lewinella sp.]